MDPAISVETAVVSYESKLSEPVHKKIDARARGADHGCQRRLRYPGKSVLLALIPPPGEQQQCAGESLLAALAELVD